MKKILASFFILVLMSLSSNAQAACTAQLQAATFSITEVNKVYTEGDTIKTALSFKFNDSATTTTGRPLRVVLVMDRSGSMGGSEDAAAVSTPVSGFRRKTTTTVTPTGDIKLAAAKRALIAAVEKIKKGAPGSQVALVSYATTVTIDSGFTSDFDGVINQISNLTAAGNTSIGGGLAAAGAGYPIGSGVMQSLDLDQAHRRVIIVASDGLENTAPLISQVTETTQTIPADVTVYSIGIGNKIDSTKMKSMGNYGNKKGKYYSVGDVARLTSIFENIITVEQSVGADTLQVALSRPNDSAVEITGATGGVITGNGNNVTWNFDHVASDQIFSLPLDFLAKQAGMGIPLNNTTLIFSYARGVASCNSTANVVVQGVDILPGKSNYSCKQEIFKCASDQACNYTKNSTPLCVKVTPAKHSTEYVDAAICESNGASCGAVVKTVCNDNCGRSMGTWKEIGP